MLLTDAQMLEIKKIIEDHHNAFIVNAIDPKAVRAEVLEELSRRGLVNTQVRSIADAYLYGQVLAASQDPRVKDMTLAEFKAYLRKNPVPLSPTESQAVSMAQQSAAQYVRGLGNRVDVRTGQMLIEADSDLRRKMRDTIRTKVEANLEARQSVKQLKSDLGWEIKDWTRDLDRISITEKQAAMQAGKADLLAKQYGSDVAVAKLLAPDCCPHCLRLYQGPDGAPRIFRLADLEANGTNVGRKVAEWLPVVGPTHPHCCCEIIRVPAGWGFNPFGELVEGGEMGIRYDAQSLRASLPAEASLRKSVQSPGAVADFQNLPIFIENPVGSTRPWKGGETTMLFAYGYIQGTHGLDGEEIDCYLGPNPLARQAFVVHQTTPEGMFDEDKVFLGFSSEQEVRDAYVAHRSDGDRCLGGIHALPMQAFKRWLAIHAHDDPHKMVKANTVPQAQQPALVISSADLIGRRSIYADGNPRTQGYAGANFINSPSQDLGMTTEERAGDMPGRQLVDKQAEAVVHPKPADREIFTMNAMAPVVHPIETHPDVYVDDADAKKTQVDANRGYIDRELQRRAAVRNTVEPAAQGRPNLVMRRSEVTRARRRTPVRPAHLRKAEGSHGGMVIGHTQSGKPVYAATSHKYHGSSSLPKRTSDRKRVDAMMADHPDFSAQDHKDAARVHAEHEAAHPGPRTQPGPGGIPKAHAIAQRHAIAAARGGIV